MANTLRLVMRGQLNYPPYQVVTWIVYNEPDNNGLQSGYPQGSLVNIQTDYIINDGSSVNPISLAVGGDLAGSLPNPTVVGLMTKPIAVAAMTPAIGDALIWDGYAWTPTSVGDALPDGTTTNDVLRWNGSGWAPSTSVITNTNNSIVVRDGYGTLRSDSSKLFDETNPFPIIDPTNSQITIEDTRPAGLGQGGQPVAAIPILRFAGNFWDGSNSIPNFAILTLFPSGNVDGKSNFSIFGDLGDGPSSLLNIDGQGNMLVSGALNISPDQNAEVAGDIGMRSNGTPTCFVAGQERTLAFADNTFWEARQIIPLGGIPTGSLGANTLTQIFRNSSNVSLKINTITINAGPIGMNLDGANSTLIDVLDHTGTVIAQSGNGGQAFGPNVDITNPVAFILAPANSINIKYFVGSGTGTAIPAGFSISFYITPA